MWDSGVKNESGMSGVDFISSMIDYFASMSALDLVLFALKLGVFIFLFFIIPQLLKKYGGSGWNE